MTLCLTTLVHLFSHFELVIIALNPRSILQPKRTVSVPEKLRILFAVYWRTPLFHPKLYNLSVCWLLNYRSLKTVLVTVIYLRFFHHLQLHPYFVYSLRNECFRRVHMPWTLVGWACVPAPRHPEIPTENCSWIAWVAFIELGFWFLDEEPHLYCIFHKQCSWYASDTRTDCVQSLCCVILALGKSGLKYHISIQRHTWLQALQHKASLIC